MKLKQIISESRNGNRMEVIGKDDDGLHTLHIRKEYSNWKYLAAIDNKGNKLFSNITI